MSQRLINYFLGPTVVTKKVVAGVGGWGDGGQEFRPLMLVCLFVLRFYGPVNPVGSCRVRSVYLTTCLLGRISPLSG